MNHIYITSLSKVKLNEIETFANLDAVAIFSQKRNLRVIENVLNFTLSLALLSLRDFFSRRFAAMTEKISGAKPKNRCSPSEKIEADCRGH